MKKAPEKSTDAGGKYEGARVGKFKLLAEVKPRPKGGKRPGAGRPRVDKKKISITVTLSESDCAYLRELGNGNLSKGVSLAARAYPGRRMSEMFKS